MGMPRSNRETARTILDISEIFNPQIFFSISIKLGAECSDDRSAAQRHAILQSEHDSRLHALVSSVSPLLENARTRANQQFPRKFAIFGVSKRDKKEFDISRQLPDIRFQK